MRKTLYLLPIFTLFCCFALITSVDSIWARTSEIKVQVNHQAINFTDAQPYIDEKGRVLVPISLLAEKIGAHVSWKPKDRQVTVTKDCTSINFIIGSSFAQVNDQKVKMDCVASLRKSRTMAPLRFVAETFGYKVTWNQQNQTIDVIEDNEYQIPEETELEIIYPKDSDNNSSLELIIKFFREKNTEQQLIDLSQILTDKFGAKTAESIVESISGREVFEKKHTSERWKVNNQVITVEYEPDSVNITIFTGKTGP